MMPKRTKKIYENPEDMEESEMDASKFASHMSFLTNKRLHELFIMRDMHGFQAGSTFQYGSILSYGAVLEGIYKEIESILKTNQRDEIEKLFIVYNDMVFKKHLTPKERYEMYKILSVIHRLMNSYLQQFQYFFRIESQPIKGIDRIIKTWLKDDKDELSGVAKK